MKALKWLLIAFAVNVGIVVLFESMLGYFQPASESTVVITTIADDGVASDRVVSRLESEGKLYVAANHWPRAWYDQALDNPNVEVDLGGPKGAYLAVPVIGVEHDRVNAEHALPVPFRILTGFPPRYLLRLDPR